VRRRARLASFVVAVVAVALMSSWLAGRVLARQEGYEKLEVFANILAMVQRHYVDDVTTKELVDGAIKGMLASLDPHSAYLPPDAYNELQVDTRGSFGGLGIEITLRSGILTIVSPIEDTPAFRAGVQAGDQIIKIDEEFTKDMNLMQAVKLMRGPKGSAIQLTIRREGVPDWIELEIVREVIRIKSVKHRKLEPGFGYLRITQFQERTDRDVRLAVKEFQDSDGGLDGMVLDLRNNPGGLLSQAVRISDLFLDSGMIVYTEGRLGSQEQKFFAHESDSLTEFPMIVLVNGGSASASEIVAGALQDHKRALVLGTQTFGKGSVQTILKLDQDTEDQESAIRLTTARYFTPNGRSIQATGITPDIVMESRLRDTGETQAPEMIREENLPRHLEGNEDEQPRELPEEGEVAEETEEVEDAQLQRALELLKSWSVFKTVVAQKSP
jgi:carboxyl-terminal processing protease